MFPLNTGFFTGTFSYAKVIRFPLCDLIYSLCVFSSFSFESTVNPIESGQSKKDKTKVLKTNGSLIKVKSIAIHNTCIGIFLKIKMAANLDKVLLEIAPKQPISHIE